MIALYNETRSQSLSEQELAVLRQAADIAFLHMGKKGNVEIFVLSAEDMRQINAEQRGVDCATDVLSFPADAECPADGYYGDILICEEKAREQAEEYGHDIKRELAFLVIHGMLHLFGYDHKAGEDERQMRALQRTILERMGQTL